MTDRTIDERDELGAAELTAALLEGREERLPPALAARLVAAGTAMVSKADVVPIRPREEPRPARPAWAPWGLAAAAVVAWLFVPSPLRRSDREDAAPPARLVTGAEALRDSLALGGAAVLRLAMAATGDPAAVGATGEVLWAGDLQRGVMTLAGLAANDPAQWQYQLWIFDGTRDDRYPVDGGVFDVPADGREVVLRLRAPVPVREPVLFAITVERAGGVVVSGRERIVLAGRVG